MFEKTFAKEYVGNMFFWWSAIIAGLSLFDSLAFTINALHAIITWYVPILFISLTFSLVYSFYPLQQGLVELRKKEGKIIAIGWVGIICMLFYAEAVYFMVDPYEIFAKLFPGVVTDKNTFQWNVYLKDLISFLALPLCSSLVFTYVKNKVIKESSTKGSIKNKIKFVAYIITINTTMYLLFVFLTSPALIQFTTWFFNHTGDVPTWILAIATPVSIYVGFRMARDQSKKDLVQEKENKKIEEQKFFLKLDEVFAREGNMTIRHMVNDEIYLGKSIDITDPDVTKLIDDYLNHLEFICNMYQEKIISESMINAFVGMRISNVLKCTTIRLYINDERIRTEEPSLWEALEIVGNELASKSQK